MIEFDLSNVNHIREERCVGLYTAIEMLKTEQLAEAMIKAKATKDVDLLFEIVETLVNDWRPR